jgi:hypothetical protein
MGMTDMGMGTVAEQEWWQNTGMADYSCSLNIYFNILNLF